MATANLWPHLDRVDPDEPEETRNPRRLKEWAERRNAFFDSVEKQKLFLPRSLLLTFRNIRGLSDKAGFNFQSTLSYGEGKLSGQSYERGEDYMREMREGIQDAITAIQHRYGIDG